MSHNQVKLTIVSMSIMSFGVIDLTGQQHAAGLSGHVRTSRNRIGRIESRLLSQDYLMTGCRPLFVAPIPNLFLYGAGN